MAKKTKTTRTRKPASAAKAATRPTKRQAQPKAPRRSPARQATSAGAERAPTYAISDWIGLYREGWKGAINDEAFKHPAKFARALIRRIYQHCSEEGWLAPGAKVIDPFGGVALGALDAMRLGLHWQGIEIEAQFVGLGQKNIDLWQKQYGQHFARWGTARLSQGDSRKLLDVISAGAAAISSPRYAHTEVTQRSRFASHKDGEAQAANIAKAERQDGYGEAVGQLSNLPASDAQLDAAISSPPYNPPMSQDHNGSRGGKRGHTPSEPNAFARYGNAPGQLEGLSMTDAQLDAVISSPPYAADSKRDHTKAERDQAEQGSGSFRGQYGRAPGQIAAMAEGDFDAAIASPPFEQSLANDAGAPETKLIRPYLPDPKAVAAYLRSARKAAGLSCREIDKRLGTVTLYSWYEGRPKGIQIPTAEHWRKLKTILSLDDRFDHGILTEIEVEATGKNATDKTGHRNTDVYGETPGQLGAMAGGGFDAAIASPPFIQTSGGTNVTAAAGPLADARLIGRHSAGNAAARGYGEADGQLSAQPAGDLDAAISSPPYENTLRSEANGIDWDKAEKAQGRKRLTAGVAAARARNHNGREYGDTTGQVGKHSGDNFWSSARAIVEQTYSALEPGAHACWVVKGFVRSGRYVDFPDQWRRLCEAVGFVTIHQHRAWVIERGGKQLAAIGEDLSLDTERKSFFRRLIEAQARAAKHWESVANAARPEWLSKAGAEIAAEREAALAKGKILKPATAGQQLKRAQALAWRAAGSPMLEIDTAIDFEVVWCMEKPKANGKDES